jgi:CTP:molybdopterin cytidylyltransferase MocA
VITAIVLAAGKSERIGRPKPLLPTTDGTPFLAAILDTMTGTRVDEVRVVVGYQAEQVIDLGGLVRHVIVHNREFERGMLSSVQAGVRALPPGTNAFLLWPVDQPLVRADTVDRIIAAWEELEAPVVVPVHRGKRGHPTLFSAKLGPELLRAPESEGARAVVHAHEKHLIEVEVDDPGILTDIDTPQAYRKAFGRELAPEKTRAGDPLRGGRR